MTDPHATAKAASLTLEECDGWIKASRDRGDDDKAQMGIARKLQIMRGK